MTQKKKKKVKCQQNVSDLVMSDIFTQNVVKNRKTKKQTQRPSMIRNGMPFAQKYKV